MNCYMNKQIFAKILDDVLPVTYNDICIDKVRTVDLLSLKNKCANRKQEAMTCRPIIRRNEEESLQLFDRLLKNENNLLLGIYKCVENKEIIGRISLYDYNSRNGSVELGYIIEKEYEGRGYITAGVKEVCKLLFKGNYINKIYAQTASFNAKSINLLLRLGFSIDGRLRQHHEYDGKLYDDYIFSLLASDKTVGNPSSI